MIKQKLIYGRYEEEGRKSLKIDTATGSIGRRVFSFTLACSFSGIKRLGVGSRDRSWLWMELSVFFLH